jgi:hypothetical protein
MQPFQFKVPNSNQGWQSRMVDWATKYLAKLEGGSIVYGHEAGPGKTLNQNLRGYLLPTPLIPVLSRCGVVMDYGDNVRFSEGEKHRPGKSRTASMRGRSITVICTRTTWPCSSESRRC